MHRLYDSELFSRSMKDINFHSTFGQSLKNNTNNVFIANHHRGIGFLCATPTGQQDRHCDEALMELDCPEKAVRVIITPGYRNKLETVLLLKSINLFSFMSGTEQLPY